MNMKKFAPAFAILFFILPSVSSAAALTQQQANSLIAVVQSSPGTPASAFISLITAFSSITTTQASSLITVVQAAPGVPANAFVNLLTSFTVDTPTAPVAVTPTIMPVATTQTQTSIIQISSVSIAPTITSAKIEWQTDKPTESKIFLSGGGLSSKLYKSESGLSTRHSVSISGLIGDTNYSYEMEAIAGETFAKKNGEFRTEVPLPVPKFVGLPVITVIEKGILAEKLYTFGVRIETDIPTNVVFSATNAGYQSTSPATVHTFQVSVPVNYHDFSATATSEGGTVKYNGKFYDFY